MERQQSRKRPDSRADKLAPEYRWQSRIPPKMSRDEYVADALEKAHLAYEVLNNEGFNRAYREIIDEALNIVIDSKPGQGDLREDNYFRIRGLQDVIMRMQGWIATAEQIAHSEENINSIA